MSTPTLPLPPSIITRSPATPDTRLLSTVPLSPIVSRKRRCSAISANKLNMCVVVPVPNASLFCREAAAECVEVLMPNSFCHRALARISSGAEQISLPNASFVLQGSGCTTVGVCGKTPEVSALQDLLLYRLKGKDLLAHHPLLVLYLLTLISS